jgi:hypothetical protein
MEIKLWTNNDGEVTDVAMMTSLSARPDISSELGLSFDSDRGSWTNGLIYHFQPQSGGIGRATAGGFKVGQPSSWAIPLVLDGPWPQPQRLEEFSRGLHGMLNGVRQQGKK